MELEILKLIYDYSIKGAFVDSKFISKLVEIVVSNRSLDKYLQNVKFTDTLEKQNNHIVCASYSPLKKEIIVDYESIQMLLENNSYYDHLFNSFEQIMFKNFIITQIILHELEHAFQSKKADDSSDNSLEAKLIRASWTLEQALKNPKFVNALEKGEIAAQDFNIYFSHFRDKYRQYYTLDPTEKLAQANSYKTVVDACEVIKKHIPNLYEFNQASLVEQMLRGYQESWNEGICPTQVYLFGTGRQNLWSELEFYNQDYNQLMDNVCNQYSLNRRLSLGLPVKYEEYDAAHEWLENTNKFRS